jgi:hypothetical protein
MSPAEPMYALARHVTDPTTDAHDSVLAHGFCFVCGSALVITCCCMVSPVVSFVHCSEMSLQQARLQLGVADVPPSATCILYCTLWFMLCVVESVACLARAYIGSAADRPACVWLNSLSSCQAACSQGVQRIQPHTRTHDNVHAVLHFGACVATHADISESHTHDKTQLLFCCCPPACCTFALFVSKMCTIVCCTHGIDSLSSLWQQLCFNSRTLPPAGKADKATACWDCGALHVTHDNAQPLFVCYCPPACCTLALFVLCTIIAVHMAPTAFPAVDS